jgi:hypothetical protein
MVVAHILDLSEVGPGVLYSFPLRSQLPRIGRREHIVLLTQQVVQFQGRKCNKIFRKSIADAGSTRLPFFEVSISC